MITSCAQEIKLVGLSLVSPSPKEEPQQRSDECDTVRRCHGDEDTARVHRLQYRVVLSSGLVDRVTMLMPWRGRPYVYKVVTYGVHSAQMLIALDRRANVDHSDL